MADARYLGAAAADEGTITNVPYIMSESSVMVRRRFEERFVAERMARDYLAVYEELLSGAFGGRGSRAEMARAAD